MQIRQASFALSIWQIFSINKHYVCLSNNSNWKSQEETSWQYLGLEGYM